MRRKKRPINRNSTEIRVWMLRNGITGADIARDTGVSEGTVSFTIHGARNIRKVLRWLVDKGCPVEILDLPDDLLPAA